MKHNQQSGQQKTLTGYLNSKLLREYRNRPDVAIVRVCRTVFQGQTKAYDTAVEAYYPSEEASERAKERGDLAFYREELRSKQLDYDAIHQQNQMINAADTVILVCHEGEWGRCHRRVLFEEITGRPHTTEDELESHYGGEGVV